MIGQGRSVCPEQVANHIYDLDLLFLIPDITNFPFVQVILLPGTELLDKCTTSSCSFSKKDAIKRLIEPYATESK